MEAKSLAQRILAVMQAVSYIQKSDKMVNGQYRFVSHDQVVGALRKPMIENGIITSVTVNGHTQEGNRTIADVEVTFMNADMPGDRMTIQCFGYGVDGSDKGPGKAVSYAVKYALLKTFCLETGDDPDNDAGEEPGDAVTGAGSGTAIDEVLDRKARIKVLQGLAAQLTAEQRAEFKAKYPNGTKGLRDSGLAKLEKEMRDAVAQQEMAKRAA